MHVGLQGFSLVRKLAGVGNPLSRKSPGGVAEQPEHEPMCTGTKGSQRDYPGFYKEEQ